MRTIYISTETGGHIDYTEEQARELWRQGGISRYAHYWTEGMEDWRPVTDFFESEEHRAEKLSVPTTPVARGFARDPRVLTRFVVVMLWLCLAGAAVAAALQVTLMGVDDRSGGDTEVTVLTALLGLVALGQLVVFLVTGVAFLRWIHRANLNVRSFGAKGLSFTPGWSVGWYFIPIACLWQPYVGMRELWQASKNPQSWFNQLPSALVGSWWGLWLLGNFMGQLAWRLNGRAAEIPSLLSDLVNIPLCLVAAKLVKEIYELQRRWAERLAGS